MAKIQLRRDTAANWASVNPIPADGEICIDKTNNKIKIGNGTSHYNDLPAFLDGYNKGYYSTETALTTAIPTGQNGWFAVIGATDTVWVWDSDEEEWKDSGNSSGTVLTLASQAEAEGGTENTKVMTALRVLQSFAYQIASYSISALNTTSKYIIGAINELVTKVTFLYPTTISYTTEIPFTRSLTIITGKTLTTNDVLTIASNPVEGGGAQLYLDGNGSAQLVTTNFDYQSGTYDPTLGVRNKITMLYEDGMSYISILNMTAV
jgi:hypothetical protein